MKRDIEILFEAEPCTGGFSPCHKDFQTASRLSKGHGRPERWTLTSSSMLQDYLNWPYAKQVFRQEHEFVRTADGKEMKEVFYGVTSLSREETDADRLLQLGRGHWGIENKLHYHRDDTLHEGRCRLKGQGVQAMAVLNNLLLGLPRNKGFETVPDARRYYTANLHEVVTLVFRSPG